MSRIPAPVEAVESVCVPESEAYVIGACLWNMGMMSEVCDMLKPEHFHDNRNARAWTAMLDIYARIAESDLLSAVNTTRKTTEGN